jgi:transcriptional regulator with XRE-family HTH domain
MAVYRYGRLITLDKRKDFAFWMKVLLSYLGITQSEIARRLGCSRNAIHVAVTGKRIPTNHKISRIAKAIEVDELIISIPLKFDITVVRKEYEKEIV